MITHIRITQSTSKSRDTHSTQILNFQHESLDFMPHLSCTDEHQALPLICNAQTGRSFSVSPVVASPRIRTSIALHISGMLSRYLASGSAPPALCVRALPAAGASWSKCSSRSVYVNNTFTSLSPSQNPSLGSASISHELLLPLKKFLHRYLPVACGSVCSAISFMIIEVEFCIPTVALA